MKVSVHIVTFDWPGGPERIGPTLAEIGRTADQAGIHSLSLMDHYLQLGPPLGAVESPMLEGYTALGFLAGHTNSTKLHLLVTGVTYRHPGLLAKIVSTLDVISGGRAWLGLGAAWYEREHAALGVPFPKVPERFERLEETLQIIRQMWSNDSGPFVGRYYQLAETINSPEPLQRPHPPIVIGGGGEQRTLRLVSRYADGWNLPVGPDDAVEKCRRKIEVLHAHCDREGRDPGTIEKSIMWVGPPPETPDAVGRFVETMSAAADLGIAVVHLVPTGPDPVRSIAAIGDHVIPRVATL